MFFSVWILQSTFFLIDSIKGKIQEMTSYNFLFIHFSMSFQIRIICVISSDIMTILRALCLESHFTGDLLKYERQRYDGWYVVLYI